MGWLLRNFRAKLLAIGVAASLWTVVAYSETEARSYFVQVDPIPPPPNLTLVKDLPQVKVEVVASAEELKSFDPKFRLKARADLSTLRKGLTTVPVRMEYDSNVTVRKVTPPAIPVEVDEKEVLDKPVRIEPAHQVPSGFHVVSTTAKPDKVTIEGPKAQVDVAEALATVDVEGQQGPIFELPRPVPVEVRDAATKKKLDRLKVTPSEVQVSITIQSDTQPGVKAVIGTTIGQPAAGYRVKDIKFTPPTVNVTGTSARLNALKEVQADPVDITGWTTDVVRTVNVRAAGVDVTPKTVQVHVFIEKNPQVPPPPTPTPTPTPTPPPP